MKITKKAVREFFGICDSCPPLMKMVQDAIDTKIKSDSMAHKLLVVTKIDAPRPEPCNPIVAHALSKRGAVPDTVMYGKESEERVLKEKLGDLRIDRIACNPTFDIEDAIDGTAINNDIIDFVSIAMLKEQDSLFFRELDEKCKSKKEVDKLSLETISTMAVQAIDDIVVSPHTYLRLKQLWEQAGKPKDWEFTELPLESWDRYWEEKGPRVAFIRHMAAIHTIPNGRKVLIHVSDRADTGKVYFIWEGAGTLKIFRDACVLQCSDIKKFRAGFVVFMKTALDIKDSWGELLISKEDFSDLISITDQITDASAKKLGF